MSSALPTIDTTAFVVGTVGSINLNNSQTNWTPSGYSGQPAHIRIFNDSGVSLKIWTDTNVINEYLAAGGWGTWEIDPGTNAMNYEVVAVLANPPVNLIMPIFYQPGEKVPDTPILGNSPIGGGAVTSGSTLSNESNSTPTQIVDIGQVGNTFLISVLSDGSFVWSVLQSGTAHQILKGQTSGNPLQVGKSGDILEVLSKLQLDGEVISPAASPITFNAPSGQQIQFLQNGTTIFFMDGLGLHLFGNFSYDLGSGGVFKFRNGNTTQAWGNFTGTGSGTYNHGFGSAPFAVIPIVDVLGSATQGYDTITSTQVHITLGASLGFRATMWS